MTASSRGCSRVTARLIASTTRPQTQLLRTPNPSTTPQSRNYALAATLTKEASVNPAPFHSSKPYLLSAGIVLSRPPLLTKEQTPFEKSFYLYQRRLNERLALPFTRYFYYKKDTPAKAAFNKFILERGGVAARDVGRYRAYGEESWNDEVLVNEDEGDEARMVREMVEEGKGEGEEGVRVRGLEEVERGVEAGEDAGQKSLQRRLRESVYLVVKGCDGDGEWGFPKGELMGREVLHTAANRILLSATGPNINHWIVGYVPIGVRTIEESQKFERQQEKVFYMKARIMAGKVDIKGSELGVSDYKWLTKGELEGVLAPRYWSQVRGMLADR